MAHINDSSERLLSLGLDNLLYSQNSIYDLAIDFGTTFTKVGALRVWPPQKSRVPDSNTSTLKSLLDGILIIDRYPGPYSSKHLSEEAPTTWVYNGHSLVTWGVDLDDYEDNEHITLGLVKLLLDESGRGATEKTKIKEKLGLVGLSVADVLTDYLRVLVRHAAKMIDSVDANEKLIRIILCIPAIWGPLAQKIMREACQKALCTGMVLRDQKDHGLITEPEAVVTFLMERYPELDVEGGDMIGVLDCGGGTSDVALLEIEERKPLHMSHAAAIDGAMLGSVFLDEAFEKLLRKRVSHLQKIPRSKLESGIRKGVGEFRHKLKAQFEIDKRELSVWFEGLPNDPDNGITPNRVWFTETEFRDMFDPLVHGNISLVKNIYERYKRNMKRENAPVKNLKYLFFVGGLSGSVYIENAVRNAFFRDCILGHSVKVKTPSSEGATAIVQGALLLASNPSIMKDVRIPHGYAIVNDEPWNKSIHGRQVAKKKCELEKRFMVPDRVEVLVQKEDIIRDSHMTPAVKRSRELFFDWNHGQPCDVEVNLWRCSERVENHAGLGELRAAGVISLAYTLTFNLEDAIDACTEMERVGGGKGVRPVSERGEQAEMALPRITRSAARSRTEEAGLVDEENTRNTPSTTSLSLPLRSVFDSDELIDLSQSDHDTTESTDGGLDSSPPSNRVIPTRRDTFFRSMYQVEVRIVGSELTFEVEAPPGGPIRKSETFRIVD